MKVSMIVAMDEGGIIGNSQDLPWKIPSDLARFKSLTEGGGFNSVIMGRKTWDSLPSSFRPLPNRVNIVLSRDSSWKEDGAESALYAGRAIEISFAEGCEECWIIGGAQIYEMFLDRVEEIHVTRVHTSESGNVSFPKWESNDWHEEVIEEVSPNQEDDFATTYSIWKRS